MAKKKPQPQSTQVNYLERGVTLNIATITADAEFNTRKAVASIEELAESIKNLGQTTAVGVTKVDDENYSLVYGFRRYAAISLLNESGVETPILADVIEAGDENKIILLNIQENVSREQLSLSEEYEAVKKLANFMTNVEIQEALGVTKTWITQRLKLGELSAVLRESVDEGLSVRAAQAINLLPEEMHEEYASRAAGQSVSNVSDLVQGRLDEINGIDPTPAEGDDDIELLDDDDDLAPLDEDEDDLAEPVDDEPKSNRLKTLLAEVLDVAEDIDERKEHYAIMLESIRWNQVTDSDKLADLISYLFMEEDDEADAEDDEA